MIRGNWSLAGELRKNERSQQVKVQKRQKHQHKLTKLKDIDPIKLYHRIKNLEDKSEKTERDDNYLKSLKEDWAFIEKNKLHESKIRTFLDQQEKDEKKRKKESTKLWGSKSVYFNPELNPLGKVPQSESLVTKLKHPLTNITTPLKKDQTKKYEIDPLIKQLNIKCPPEDPPKFYKFVQNTTKPKVKPAEEQPHLVSENTELNHESSSENSANDDSSDDEGVSKRIKLG
ncbi:uncharacterized protein SPAPADRAFT_135605 [Spathaspora passalidarum NRRL Y-27907]|uniref:Uncharacterized protein n=1 Tax=Spathaspora passalidarum (strain NRRL Y-27907 / 11-Y1) TaxID=619300 RepID=G3AKZ3_SPAPN|nr:uncharacterized protein SPAPADRAFT_135605 [Spathaspora passalidarum NRRL Y-27907]EGW33036.1 hypothetical protein SPAPADRAFT_135605 [Spathaspora passalidarum NRRL Y-27907]